MIRLFLACLLVSLGVALPSHSDIRSVYTIRDIEVDQTAGSVIAARDLAMADARLRGAQIMIDKITLAEDRMAAGGLFVDPVRAESLAAAVDVQEETAGAGRYRGTLSVVYNPQMVREYLDRVNVPYVDTQAPLALMVPLTNNIMTEDLWRLALGERNEYALAPYVTSFSPGYRANSDWFELSTEATALGARRGVLAELLGDEGAYFVRLSIVTVAGTEVIGTTFTAPDMEGAAAAAVDLLESYWKHATVIRSNTVTPASASVLYTSLAEWNTLRGAMAKSPMVSEFKIDAIARTGALISFSYAGEAPRLQRDLLQRGVALAQEDGVWVLRSAVSSSGGQ